MTPKKFFPLIFAALLTSAACNKEVQDQGDNSITPEDDVIVIGENCGDSSQADIMTGSPWTSAVSAEWLKTDPSEGEAGKHSITVTATQDNAAMQERTAVLTISCGDSTEELTVIQRGAEGIELISQAPETDSDTTAKVLVRTKEGTAIDISSDGDWVSFKSLTRTETPSDTIQGTDILSEYNEYELSLAMEENPSYFNKRTGDITVSAGDYSFEITLTQGPKKIEPLFMPGTSGAVAEITAPEKDIAVSTESDWFTVSVNEGIITVETTSDNTEMSEKYGYVTITTGGKSTDWTVIQRGLQGIELLSSETDFTVTRYVDMKVRCSQDTELLTDCEWIDSYSLTPTGKSTEIGDTGIESSYNDFMLTLILKDNPSEDSRRDADITVSAPENSFVIHVEQLEGRLANKAFYRRGVGFRFTATWCGYCPKMCESFQMAWEKNPDRFIPLAIHCGGSALEWADAGKYQTKYNVTGLPSGVFNACAVIPNYTSSAASGANLIERLTDEMTEYNYAHTGIAATSSVSGNTLDLEIEITAIEKDDYTVAAFIVEDGIVSPQTDYDINGIDEDYVHDFVIRQSITAAEGDSYTIETGETRKISLSAEIPENVIRDNAYIVIYVLKPGEQRVTDVKTDYLETGHYIDNAITVDSLNGSTELQYEE